MYQTGVNVTSYSQPQGPELPELIGDDEGELLGGDDDGEGELLGGDDDGEGELLGGDDDGDGELLGGDDDGELLGELLLDSSQQPTPNAIASQRLTSV